MAVWHLLVYMYIGKKIVNILVCIDSLKLTFGMPSICLSLRRLILELASCIVEGSDEDLVNLLFSITKRALQVC